jgi:outer membrane lipoprotein SlyB
MRFAKRPDHDKEFDMAQQGSKTIGVCPRCGDETEIGTLVGAKIGGAAAGAAVGGYATEHWLGMLAGAAVGAAVGHVIDEQVLPRCPACRVALEVVNVML